MELAKMEELLAMVRVGGLFTAAVVLGVAYLLAQVVSSAAKRLGDRLEGSRLVLNQGAVFLRFFIYFAGTALAFFSALKLSDQTLLAVAMTLTWLHARRWHAGPWSRLYEPVSRGLVTAFCLGLMTSLLDDMSEPKVGSVTTVTSTLLLLWVAYDAMCAAKLQLTGRAGGLIALGVSGTAALTFVAPGVMGAALCLGLGLHRRSRWLVGVATVFFCVFMSRFYYQLSIDLLAKSGMLIASGALLFAISRAVSPRDGRGEESA